MARGLPFTYGPSRTAPKSSTARAMGVFMIWYFERITSSENYYLKADNDFDLDRCLFISEIVISFVSVI